MQECGSPSFLNEIDSVYGDINLDGFFDFQDLLVLFASGEYDDDIAGNSDYAEGDWNGDGDATSDDLLFAFSLGGYTQSGQHVADDAAINIRQPKLATGK